MLEWINEWRPNYRLVMRWRRWPPFKNEKKNNCWKGNGSNHCRLPKKNYKYENVRINAQLNIPKRDGSINQVPAPNEAVMLKNNFRTFESNQRAHVKGATRKREPTWREQIRKPTWREQLTRESPREGSKCLCTTGPRGAPYPDQSSLDPRETYLLRVPSRI